MSLDRRLDQLEKMLESESNGPCDAQRLRDALDRIQEQRRQGSESPEESPDLEGPFADRLAYALRRAAEARRLLRQ
jgi:hypothetical protein